MPSTNVRTQDDIYFEYQVIAGPWKGLRARFVSQPTSQPDYIDVDIRDGNVQRGPLRLPLSQIKWLGPHN